jgi:N-acetylglucosamine-6-phosphate deacetylase
VSGDLVVLGNVVTPTGVLSHAAVAIADGHITDVVPARQAPNAPQTRDHRGIWILTSHSASSSTGASTATG